MNPTLVSLETTRTLRSYRANNLACVTEGACRCQLLGLWGHKYARHPRFCSRLRSLTSPSAAAYVARTACLLNQHCGIPEKETVNYQTQVRKNTHRVSDLAFTLGNRREHLPHGAFDVASLLGSFTSSLLYKPSETPNIVMVFTGQGAQWPQMGRCMLQNFSNHVFRKRIQSLDGHLQNPSDAPEWSK